MLFATVAETTLYSRERMRAAAPSNTSSTTTADEEGSDGAGCAVLPQHILAFLEQKLGRDAVVRVEEAKSAQQRVLIVSLSLPEGGNEQKQQLQLQHKNNNRCYDRDDEDAWLQALKNGRNRVVVRIWTGTSRWWNLNHTTSTISTEPTTAQDTTAILRQSEQLQRHIAEQEIWGYISARRAFDGTTTRIRIPRVLHVSSAAAAAVVDQSPWAVLEYVGEHSTLYDDDDTTVPDDSWAAGMIKVRDEFGFAEPHPRWGRVPVNDSLEYAMTVLHSVILPLHLYFFSASSSLHVADDMQTFNYMNMIDLYKTKYEALLIVNNANSSATAVEGSVDKLQDAIQKLGRAIHRLEQEAITVAQSQTNELPPVPCHMDCQPQNLMFARDKNNSNKQESAPFIVSVLDWEEAAYADPRFELLMLCRKVCANRQQAEQIWQKYQEEMNVELGSMEPWLKLETVHSLTMLLLQATSGGGRSPWESKPDLWGKIEREFQRLLIAGWTLCAI